MTTNVDDPVLIASIPTETEPPYALLIDGCHRLYKAAMVGRAELPSLVLTVEETLDIRHPASLGPTTAAPRQNRRRHP